MTHRFLRGSDSTEAQEGVRTFSFHNQVNENDSWRVEKILGYAIYKTYWSDTDFCVLWMWNLVRTAEHNAESYL